MELFKAKDHHGVELGLGITCNGVSVFKGRLLITTFAWYVRLHGIEVLYAYGEEGMQRPSKVNVTIATKCG